MKIVRRIRCSNETCPTLRYRKIVIDIDDIENSLLGRLLRWTDVQYVDTRFQKFTELMTPGIHALIENYPISNACSYVLK